MHEAALKLVCLYLLTKRYLLRNWHTVGYIYQDALLPLDILPRVSTYNQQETQVLQRNRAALHINAIS